MRTPAQTIVESERLNFRTLLLSNPNYFGTLAGSKLPVVKDLARNTQYEELVCVGFHPQLSQLEAVVHVHKSTGYGGSLCSGGSPEYVRFFLSYDDGATWQDQGVAQFTAYNFAHDRHLEYAVTLPVSPPRKFCTRENVVRVRAILSWNHPPTAGDPSFVPVWGNVKDAHVQVAPRTFFDLADAFQDYDIEIPDGLLDLVKVKKPIPIPEPEPWPLEKLAASYERQKIPQTRYMLKHVTDLAKVGSLNLHAQVAASKIDLSHLKIDWASLIKVLGAGDGNETYESLACVGFDPVREALAGVVHVKLKSGYSGPLCSAGSTEYVAFWVDWGSGWQYVGTGAVRVHDIDAMPKDGLDYAVYSPINTAAHRKNCAQGPATARVRAILSWNVAPPTDDPDFTPVWGNREETLIHLVPGAVQSYRPIIESVGSVAACAIDQATGKTYLPADQPFGGGIVVTGLIPNAPDLSTASGAKLRYRVQVRELPSGGPVGAWQTLGNSFGVTITQQIGAALPTQFGLTQTVDADGFYTYEEDMDPSGAGWRLVTNRVLAVWNTSAPMHGMYEIRVEAKDPTTGVVYPAQTLLCNNGTSRTTVKVYLDELAPDVALAVTGYTRGGVLHDESLPCGTYQVGDILTGTYSVSDEHFASLSLTVEPTASSHGAVVAPSSRSFPLVPTGGESAEWTLDTTGMDPCGYVIRLVGVDRTLNGGGGWWSQETIGFCLKAA